MNDFVPSIFWHKMRNILILAERRRRIRAGQTYRLIVRLEKLKLRDKSNKRGDVILSLARGHLLAAYDAAYLALAMAIRSSLMTLDKKLAAATRLEGVPILGPYSA